MAATYLWVNGKLAAVGADGMWSTDPSAFPDWSTPDMPVAGPAAPPVTAGGAAAPAAAQDYAPTILYVSTAAQLAAAILTVDAASYNASYVIEIGTAPDGSQSESPVTIHLAGDLPVLEHSVTIDGNGSTIDGGGAYRGFLASSGTIALANLTFDHTAAIGGKGGDASNAGGGGGGAGLGGGLFVATHARVTISNVNFHNTSAHGGDGGVGSGLLNDGAAGGGGGGGMGGNGGIDGGSGNNQGGGGGGIGVGADGGQGGASGYSAPVDGGSGIMPYFGTPGPFNSFTGYGASGSSHKVTYKFGVYDYFYVTHGGNGGDSGGGGGGGAGGGGGGGGFGTLFPGEQNGGSYGASLNFNTGNMLIDMLAALDVFGPEVSIPLGIALGIATYELKAHGLGAYTAPSWHISNDAGDDSEGIGVPGLQKVPGVPPGFGLGASIGLDKSGYVPGGSGGWGGGGGGGGPDSAGGLGRRRRRARLGRWPRRLRRWRRRQRMEQWRARRRRRLGRRGRRLECDRLLARRPRVQRPARLRRRLRLE